MLGKCIVLPVLCSPVSSVLTSSISKLKADILTTSPLKLFTSILSSTLKGLAKFKYIPEKKLNIYVIKFKKYIIKFRKYKIKMFN